MKLIFSGYNYYILFHTKGTQTNIKNPGNVSDLLIQDNDFTKGAQILTLEKLPKNFIQYW